MEKSLSQPLALPTMQADRFDRFVLALTALSLLAVPIALSLGASAPSVAEVVGIVSGFCVLWLARIETPWTWLAASVNALAFGWIFLSIGAYANVAFQALILCLCVYGFAYWLRRTEDDTPVAIRRTARREWAVLAALCLGFVAVLTATRADLPRPVIATDALTTALGIAATWLQTRKRLEGWLVNGAMVGILIPLFLFAGAHVLALTGPAFVATCIANHRVWSARMRARPEARR